jgi:hypothetical protein
VKLAVIQILTKTAKKSGEFSSTPDVDCSGRFIVSTECSTS